MHACVEKQVRGDSTIRIIETMKSRIFILLFVILLVNWLLLVSTVRVYDISLSDRLGLLSVLPPNFIFGLFALALLALLSTYSGKYRISILFTMLFSVYFYITPWIVEPLRSIDTLVHFSRVAVVNDLGRLPPTLEYYFDFPGSTVFASSLLSITGFDEFLFLKYVFPIFSMLVFYLGFSVFMYKTYRDLRFVSLGLLFVSIFGYGSSHFSPYGIGLMWLPLLLDLMMEIKKRSYSICFLILVIGLTITNPTIAAFSVMSLFVYLILLKFVNQRIESRMALRTTILIVFFVLWLMFVSSGTLSQVVNFVREIGNVIFFHPSEAGTRLIQPAYPIIEVRLANYFFIGLSTLLSILILLYVGRTVFIRKKWTIASQRLRMLIAPCIIFVGLTFVGLYFIAVWTDFALRGATFAFLGTAMGIGFLNVKSKRHFFVLAMIALLLVMPAFIHKHDVEQWDIMQDPIKLGLMFTGKHIKNDNVKIICPYGAQLRPFMKWHMWHNIEPHYSVWDVIKTQPLTADYFIYRIDGLYYATLQIDGFPKENTSYFKAYVKLLNAPNFNLVYSSKGYEMLAKLSETRD